MATTKFLEIPAISDQSLSEKVADQLREAIVCGQITPGQHIVELDVVNATKISRGPVRDALRILENEHLVVRYPRRGTFVTRLGLRDAEEIYSLRESLEMVALEYAVQHATDAQLDELELIVAAMERRLEQQHTAYELADIDLEFHHMLCQISGHSRVITAWNNLRPQIRFLILTHRIPRPITWKEDIVERHKRIVATLRQRDLAMARKVFHEHLAYSLESTLAVIRKATSTASTGTNTQ
jgi:DNA-binding GntR family transcriptional regulator